MTENTPKDDSEAVRALRASEGVKEDSERSVAEQFVEKYKSPSRALRRKRQRDAKNNK